jgi:hypothetical protein
MRDGANRRRRERVCGAVCNTVFPRGERQCRQCRSANPGGEQSGELLTSLFTFAELTQRIPDTTQARKGHPSRVFAADGTGSQEAAGPAIIADYKNNVAGYDRRIEPGIQRNAAFVPESRGQRPASDSTADATDGASPRGVITVTWSPAASSRRDVRSGGRNNGGAVRCSDETAGGTYRGPKAPEPVAARINLPFWTALFRACFGFIPVADRASRVFT